MNFIYILFSLSLLIPNDFSKSNPNYNSNVINIDSTKYITQLGRNKDPKLISDISPFRLLLRKINWEILTFPGLRTLTKLIYPISTISYFDRKGAVAFTIDDGFCGIDNSNGCMLEEIRMLLKSYDATATFFVTGSHCNHTNKKTVQNLLKDGHELANHNMMDWPYNQYSSDAFSNDLEQTELILSTYRMEAPKWYRAPFGRLSKEMQKIIDEKGMIHIVSDAFANDTTIPDPDWIASYILRKVKPGSIILIHMPEKNVREWNYAAIEKTLLGLKKNNYKILNLTQLYNNNY